MGIEWVTDNTSIFDGKGMPVITTNCIGAMGKGIALEAKQRDPEMYQVYRQMCKDSILKPGEPRLCMKDEHGNYKYILAPTKYNWRYPSRYYWVESILRSIRDAANNGKLTRDIELPPLGCGNGKLDWTRVKRMITHYLSDVPITVRVYPPQTHR